MQTTPGCQLGSGKVFCFCYFSQSPANLYDITINHDENTKFGNVRTLIYISVEQNGAI